MIRVLFVCLGNICRSPMTEAAFRNIVDKAKLSEKIEVDSADTAGWYIGKAPHQGTKEILDQNLISYKGRMARQFDQDDWTKFDYIITMDDQNNKDLKSGYDQDHYVIVAKLMDFVYEPKEVNIPDPYCTGDFDYTYNLVMQGLKGLLIHIKGNYNI